MQVVNGGEKINALNMIFFLKIKTEISTHNLIQELHCLSRRLNAEKNVSLQNWVLTVNTK